jgi:hypothetical protein
VRVAHPAETELTELSAQQEDEDTSLVTVAAIQGDTLYWSTAHRVVGGIDPGESEPIGESLSPWTSIWPT